MKKILLSALILLCCISQSAAWMNVTTVGGGVPAAGPDYTATVAKIYLNADGGNHASIRITIYGPDNALIATTNEVTSVDSSGVLSFSFASNPTLSATGTYYLTLCSSTNYFIAWVAGTAETAESLWKMNYISMTYPTFPDPINTGSASGSLYGGPAIWLENASGQKIVGDNVTSGKAYSKGFGNDKMYFNIDGYTRETL